MGPPGTTTAGAERLVSRLLRAPVQVVESFGDREATLFPEEAAHVADVAPGRRVEFVTVRAHARAALHALGLPPAPLVPGGHGEPCWPVGVVGSLTHCAGYRAAAVAWRDDVVSIGVDAEPSDALPEGVLPLVADADERSALAELPSRRVPWDRLLCSAKESVYKAWYPLTHEWLDFHDVKVLIAPDGTYAARLRRAAVVDGRRLDRLVGRWVASGTFVATAVEVRHVGAAR